MKRTVDPYTQLMMYARRLVEQKERLDHAEAVCKVVTDYRRRPQTTWYDVLKLHDAYLAGKEKDDG
jgi:hypothetical protein